MLCHMVFITVAHHCTCRWFRLTYDTRLESRDPVFWSTGSKRSLSMSLSEMQQDTWVPARPCVPSCYCTQLIEGLPLAQEQRLSLISKQSLDADLRNTGSSERGDSTVCVPQCVCMGVQHMLVKWNNKQVTHFMWLLSRPFILDVAVAPLPVLINVSAGLYQAFDDQVSPLGRLDG